MELIGTVIWWGPDKPWGYIGHGIFTNSTYEFQIFAHYKHISKINQKNPRFKEIKPKDIVKFRVVEGYNGKGTQAEDITIVKYAESNDKDGWPSEADQESEEPGFTSCL